MIHVMSTRVPASHRTASSCSGAAPSSPRAWACRWCHRPLRRRPAGGCCIAGPGDGGMAPALGAAPRMLAPPGARRRPRQRRHPVSLPRRDGDRERGDHGAGAGQPDADRARGRAAARRAAPPEAVARPGARRARRGPGGGTAAPKARGRGAPSGSDSSAWPASPAARSISAGWPRRAAPSGNGRAARRRRGRDGGADELFERPHAVWTFPAVASVAWNVIAVSIGAMGLYDYMLKRGAAGRVAANFYLIPGPCPAWRSCRNA